MDQADGLRRLFAGSRTRFVPLVSNPHVAFAGVMIERLAAAFADEGAQQVLVVDAAEAAPEPAEIAHLDLAEAIEPVAPRLAHLAARGLPRRHVDARGSAGSFLDAIADAAPAAEVVLVHAPAPDLARLFARRAARPIVLACDHPAAVMHGYAGLKWLVQRASLLAHDLLLGAAGGSPRAPRIAAQLASCAELFLGAALRDWALVDPADAERPPSAALRRVARDALALADDAPPAPAVRPSRAAAFAHA